ncbi:MAG: hypothetical protein EBR40_11500 [Proteobacteria bacterium]|nr:hypothetical protein [Pseudomonadota bacterium]
MQMNPEQRSLAAIWALPSVEDPLAHLEALGLVVPQLGTCMWCGQLTPVDALDDHEEVCGS